MAIFESCNLKCILAGSAIVLMSSQAAAQQMYEAPKARRQFVTFSYDWTYAFPLHFDKYPLEDLVGAEVDETDPPYDYRTEDGTTLIDVLEYARRGNGVGVTIYPLGMSTGATLGVRGSIQNLPKVRVRFDGPGALDSYELTDAIAYDVGAGVFVADRSPGWGIGSYALLLGGVGRVTSELGGGGRYFAEGGGGVQSGPFGFELSVKFGWNHLSEPLDHHFLAVPINMRATVSF